MDAEAKEKASLSSASFHEAIWAFTELLVTLSTFPRDAWKPAGSINLQGWTIQINPLLQNRGDSKVSSKIIMTRIKTPAS